MQPKKPFRRALMAAALVMCGAAFAQGDAFPSKPIKLVAGFAVGGPSDVLARALGQALSNELGQPVVVENRTGANGVVAMDSVTAAPADGYTIGLLANTTTTALIYANKPLDIPNRFSLVGRFASTRILLVVNPTRVPVKTLPELVEFLRKNPDTPMTSAGHGGLGHLGLELFAQEQKLKVLHVAYRGSAPALTDVIGGTVAGMIIDASTALPHLQSGKIRAIAVASTERVPYLPELPTGLEQGYKSLQVDNSFGLVLPPKTPQAVVDRWRTALRRAVDSPLYTEASNKAGNARFFEDAAGYREWMQKDFDRWAEVVKIANIKAE